MGVSNRESSAVGGECGRDSSDVARTVPIEVSPFGEVLGSRQSVGVLVRAALPRTAGVAEEDVQPSVDTQLSVLGHLAPWSQVRDRRS